MENKRISNRLTEEVKKLLFSEGLSDKLIGFEVSLMTYHGWFATWVIDEECMTYGVGKDGRHLTADDESIQKTFQGVLTNTFFINKILADGPKKNWNHEQMQHIDQIFFDVENDDYNDICRVARVGDRNKLLALPVFADRKETYNEWKQIVAQTYYKNTSSPNLNKIFSYVFFPVCRSSRNGSMAAGSIFMVLNLERLTTSADLMTFLARCHTLRISLNFLIEHQYGRDIANLQADPIKAKIIQFIKLTIIQPPKGNPDYTHGWFSGIGTSKAHLDKDNSQQNFISGEINISQEFHKTYYKGLFETNINPNNKDFIIQYEFEARSIIPLSMFKSLLSYFMVDETICVESEEKYIGLPCRPGWIFVAGLVLLIHNLEGIEKLCFVKKPIILDKQPSKEKRWNCSISFMLPRNDNEEGASGLVKSLYYGRRKGRTAQNLHDFTYLRLNSPEFNNIANEFTADEIESTLAKLLVKGADSPVIYYNIEDMTLTVGSNKRNYIAVKINWESKPYTET